MTSEPRISRTTRLVGRLWDVVGVRQAVLRHGRGGAPRASPPARLSRRDLGEQRPQLLVVGAGHRRQRVEGGQHEGLLLGLEVDVQDGDGRLPRGEGELDPEMAVDERGRCGG